MAAEPGVIHIISEIGGCVVGGPPDVDGISRSLRFYAEEQGLEGLDVINLPGKPRRGGKGRANSETGAADGESLGEWADIAEYAVRKWGAEGVALAGRHEGQRALVAVSKRYGYPAPGASLDDRHIRIQFPGGERLAESSRPWRVPR